MPSLPERESLDYLLAQICRLHHSRARTLLEDLGLYRGQPPVLFALWAQEGLTHGELATELQVQPATITKMIQRMEKAGFVERRPDDEDERVSRVYLTQAGRSVQVDVERVWGTLEAETFRAFAEDERAVLRSSFERIRDNLIAASGRFPSD